MLMSPFLHARQQERGLNERGCLLDDPPVTLGQVCAHHFLKSVGSHEHPHVVPPAAMPPPRGLDVACGLFQDLQIVEPIPRRSFRKLAFPGSAQEVSAKRTLDDRGRCHLALEAQSHRSCTHVALDAHGSSALCPVGSACCKHVDDGLEPWQTLSHLAKIPAALREHAEPGLDARGCRLLYALILHQAQRSGTDSRPMMATTLFLHADCCENLADKALDWDGSFVLEESQASAADHASHSLLDGRCGMLLLPGLLSTMPQPSILGDEHGCPVPRDVHKLSIVPAPEEASQRHLQLPLLRVPVLLEHAPPILLQHDHSCPAAGKPAACVVPANHPLQRSSRAMLVPQLHVDHRAAPNSLQMLDGSNLPLEPEPGLQHVNQGSRFHIAPAGLPCSVMPHQALRGLLLGDVPFSQHMRCTGRHDDKESPAAMAHPLPKPPGAPDALHFRRCSVLMGDMVPVHGAAHEGLHLDRASVLELHDLPLVLPLPLALDADGGRPAPGELPAALPPPELRLDRTCQLAAFLQHSRHLASPPCDLKAKCDTTQEDVANLV
mmetsp:Transcript_68735/g.177031  ORF Transcript_68735/g.177031 Transcript_68735/m.177031 type:complete len:550 (+) Transcript_68735:414-2063(+)